MYVFSNLGGLTNDTLNQCGISVAWIVISIDGGHGYKKN